MKILVGLWLAIFLVVVPVEAKDKAVNAKKKHKFGKVLHKPMAYKDYFLSKTQYSQLSKEKRHKYVQQVQNVYMALEKAQKNNLRYQYALQPYTPIWSYFIDYAHASEEDCVVGGVFRKMVRNSLGVMVCPTYTRPCGNKPDGGFECGRIFAKVCVDRTPVDGLSERCLKKYNEEGNSVSIEEYNSIKDIVTNLGSRVCPDDLTAYSEDKGCHAFIKRMQKLKAEFDTRLEVPLDNGEVICNPDTSGAIKTTLLGGMEIESSFSSEKLNIKKDGETYLLLGSDGKQIIFNTFREQNGQVTLTNQDGDKLEFIAPKDSPQNCHTVKLSLTGEQYMSRYSADMQLDSYEGKPAATCGRDGKWKRGDVTVPIAILNYNSPDSKNRDTGPVYIKNYKQNGDVAEFEFIAVNNNVPEILSRQIKANPKTDESKFVITNKHGDWVPLWDSTFIDPSDKEYKGKTESYNCNNHKNLFSTDRETKSEGAK